MNSQGERHTPREPKETHEVEVAAPLRVLPKTATTRRLMLDAGDSRKKSIFSKTYFSYTLDSQCFQGSNALFGGFFFVCAFAIMLLSNARGKTLAQRA